MRVRIAVFVAACSASVSRAGLPVELPPPVGQPERALGVEVAIPARADDPLVVRDASGLGVEVRLEGSTPVPIERGAIHMYRGALQLGAERFDVRVREVRDGLEDFIDFDRAPEREVVRYQVHIGNAAGLRLVDDTLELLDAGGAPRLRMNAPTIIDAAGATHRVRVAVRGCAVDRDARGPWGRTPTPPGARRCQVELGWGAAIGEPIAYPAVLDPAWVRTPSMAQTRHHHTAVLLPDGKVLVAGGYLVGATYGAGAELFDPATRTWSTTAPMTRPRANTQAVLFPSGPLAGKVLLAGGDDGLEPTSELYDPTTGTWTALAPMAVPRDLHRVELLGNGEVLAVGGCYVAANGACAGVSASGETFDPATLTWTRVDGALAQTRVYFSLTALADGRALVAGGCERFDASGCTRSLDTTAIYDPARRVFEPAAPLPGAVQNHDGWRLDDGSIIVAGGSRAGAVSRAAYRYRPTAGVDGTWEATPRLGSAHVAAAGVVMPGGKLLVTGSWGIEVGPVLMREAGLDAGAYLTSAETELFDPIAGTWSPGPSLIDTHGAHSATLLPDGVVLIAGGLTLPYMWGTEATAKTEILDPTILSLACGDPLTLGGPCARCAASVCCDQLAACADDPACAPLGACFAMCGVGGSYECLADCARACPAGAKTFTGLAACVASEHCWLACVEETGDLDAPVRCGDEDPTPDASEPGPEAIEAGPEASEPLEPDAVESAAVDSGEVERDAVAPDTVEPETVAGADAATPRPDDSADPGASDAGCGAGGGGALGLVVALGAMPARRRGRGFTA